ncbi:MAG: tetratricopeptide repeat protein [bacterium]
MRRIVFVLLLAAAAIRVAHLVELRADPFLDRPIMDAEYHDLWAQSINSGQPYFVSPVFFRAPFYPYLLAGVYRVLGPGPWPIRVVQCVLGLASLYLIFSIARRLCGVPVAVLSLILAVLYDLFPYYEGELLLPTVLIFLDLLAMEVLTRASVSRSAVLAGLAGGVFGLSAITRPNVLIAVPFLAIWFWRTARLRLPAAAFVGASFLLPLGITALNAVRGDDAVFIASQGGVNFYLGNNKSSNGWSAVAPGMRADWWGSYEDGIKIPERHAGRTLKPSEVSAYWTDRALDEIRSDPGWWVSHLLKKTYMWFAAEELSNNRDLQFWIPRFPAIDTLPIRYAIIAPLAIIGMFLLPARATAPLALFVVPYAFSFVLFFITSRYRVITVPFLCILAGGALYQFGSFARDRRYRSLVLWGAGLAAVTAFLSANVVGTVQPSFSLSHMEIGKREVERGRWDAAQAEFRKALAFEPGNLDARHDLGVALREGGDPAAGLTELQAVAAQRNDATSWNNTGLALMMLDRLREAEDAFMRAIDRDPGLGDAWLNAALLAGDRGESALALDRLAKGEALRGEDPMIWYHRGRFLENLGRRGEARGAYERALRLAPAFTDASERLGAMLSMEPDNSLRVEDSLGTQPNEIKP